jgi:hypothetical protein
MPKREVHYNEQAVLCPTCTKRIRLNNSGRLRVHWVGKRGSATCKGSNCYLVGSVLLTDNEVMAMSDESFMGFLAENLPPPQPESDTTLLFSDSA